MSVKRVLLLSQFFPPESNSAANRIGAMAEALSKEFDVRVVTLRPSYPSSALFEGANDSIQRRDSGRPYAIERVFRFSPHRGGLFVRALREHSMALGLAARAITAPADIVVTSSPTMFLGPVGLVLARIKGVRFVWDVRDITWRYASEVVDYSWRVALGARALEAYMVRVLRRADLLAGATPGLSRVLVESGADPDRVVTVFNGISEDLLDIPQKDAEKGTASIRPVVAFVGMIGYNQGLGVALDAASLLPEADFLIVGDGPELSMLQERAEKLSLTNVSFTGWLNKDQLLKVYEQTDVLFAHLKSTPILDTTAVSFKLFEYMATGRPFVYAGKGVAVEFLSKIGCAVTVPPDDPRALSAAIFALLQDPEKRRALGSKGRAFVEHNYRRDKLMERFTRTLLERFP